MNGNVVRHFKALALTGLLVLGTASPAAALSITQTVYFRPLGSNSSDVLLVDRVGGTRARVVNMMGSTLASVAHEGSQQVFSLDTPLSQTEFSADPDSCGDFPPLRRDISQIVVRHASGGLLRGTSQVVEIGTLTPTEGCDAGVSVPFGAPTDPGATVNRLAMVARPLMVDLLPGTRIAGFSEQEWLPDDHFIAADVVTFHAGGQALFAASGRVVPAAFNAERWLVLNLGTFERAYTRLEVDLVTGAETWLRADWSGGQAQRVFPDLVVKPATPASFGNEAQASRIWESGLFFTSQAPFFIHLYPGGMGERVLKDLEAGTETRATISWFQAGSTIAQSRISSGGLAQLDRTWVPLRNRGNIRFVMESETSSFNGGAPEVIIRPRVNFYIDRGAAVPPTAP
jgi:hypothetical protein